MFLAQKGATSCKNMLLKWSVKIAPKNVTVALTKNKTDILEIKKCTRKTLVLTRNHCHSRNS